MKQRSSPVTTQRNKLACTDDLPRGWKVSKQDLENSHAGSDEKRGRKKVLEIVEVGKMTRRSSYVQLPKSCSSVYMMDRLKK